MEGRSGERLSVLSRTRRGVRNLKLESRCFGELHEVSDGVRTLIARVLNDNPIENVMPATLTIQIPRIRGFWVWQESYSEEVTLTRNREGRVYYHYAHGNLAVRRDYEYSKPDDPYFRMPYGCVGEDTLSDVIEGVDEDLIYVPRFAYASLAGKTSNLAETVLVTRDEYNQILEIYSGVDIRQEPH